MTNPILSNIILNENGYFLTKEKESDSFFSKSYINKLFNKASSSKIGNYLLNIRKEPENVHGEQIEYSICFFKFISYPSFIDKRISKWEEQKIAYLLLIDFKDYVFVSKKNIVGIDDILFKDLLQIDYGTLTTLFVNDTTNFEKFSLNNTSVSYDAIKGKTLEANDLKKSFAGFGAGKYTVSSVRLNNNDEKTSIVFNTSRITSFGEKKYVNELFEWAYEVVINIRTHIDQNSFLNIFAEHIEYEKIRDTLKPISILFNLTRLNNDIERNKIINCEIVLEDGRTKRISLNKILVNLKDVFSIEEELTTEGSNFKIKNNFIKDLSINLNRKSITLSSKKARRLFFTFDNGTKYSFLNYFNLYNEFIINFEDLSIVYTNRKLFKDNKLIGYIDNFINVFKGKSEINSIISEKGTFTTTSVGFTADSLFGFVEAHLTQNSDYSFLDDLGDEWADFIKIKNNSISLIHAKHGDSQLSASSFHDVVGQALKNIGNISPSNTQLEITKKAKWGSTYNIDNKNTNIGRLRHGDNITNAISFYKKLLITPNIKKEIILVVDFISRSNLKDKLEKLQRNESFTEKNQVIQILWIISSLVNSCAENGIDIHIYCKP